MFNLKSKLTHRHHYSNHTLVAVYRCIHWITNNFPSPPPPWICYQGRFKLSLCTKYLVGISLLLLVMFSWSTLVTVLGKLFQSCIYGKNLGLSYHCNSYTLFTANPELELISFVLHVLDPLLKSQGNRKSTVYVVLKDNGGGECKSLRMVSSF